VVPGFDTLPIDFYPPSNPSHKKTVEFLLSSDGKTLAQMTKYDVTNLPGANISVAGRPVRGEPEAQVEIVIFDDLECPYCAMMHTALFPETLEHYKGLIKVVYKDDPLTEIHPWAMRAAVDARCLAMQSGDSYWKYIDYLHSHYRDITIQPYDAKKASALLDILARNEGTRDALNEKVLNGCILQQDETTVRASMKEAEQLRIDGTPALFVDGERISGAQPQMSVWAAIDRALRARGIRPPDRPAPDASHPSAVASNTPK
jgi:protein-disulfide isomerase